MRLSFASFSPDAAELDTGVTPVALNVYPEKGSYRPVPGPAPYSDAIDANPRGLWIARTTARDFDAFCATDETLKKLTGTTWGDIGTGFTGPPTDSNWAGVQFGTLFFFNNVTDGLQKFDIEAGVTTSAVGGSSPAAEFMDVVESYLMCGGLSDDPGGVEWSDTEDGTTWGSGNSGGQSFKDGGAVTAICGAAHMVVQETAIRTIIGDPGGDIFQFQKVEQAKGAIAPGSVIRFGETFAYLAEDGFWWRGEPIGQGKVNRYFFSSVNQNRIFSTLGVLDPFRPLMHWLFRKTESDLYDGALTFNWSVGEWSEWEPNAYFAAASATPGITLEQLSVLYPDLETVPYSLDSRVWQGGRPVFAIFDEDLKLAFMEGANLEATMETGERNLIPGYRSKILAARPIVDSTAAVLAVRARQRQGDTVSFSSEKAQQSSGLCKFNNGGWGHRFRLRIPASSSWTQAQGIEIPDYGITKLGPR